MAPEGDWGRPEPIEYGNDAQISCPMIPESRSMNQKETVDVESLTTESTYMI